MENSNYAGFWMRFLALLIDGIIVGIVYSFLIAPLLAFMGFGFASAAENFESGNMTDAEAMGMMGFVSGAIVVVSMVTQVIYILYFAIMESSKYQGTLGKMALGIQVTTAEGEKLNFGQALLRNLGKIVSQVILYIGFIMAAFTQKKQALHDLIAGTLVVKK